MINLNFTEVHLEKNDRVVIKYEYDAGLESIAKKIKLPAMDSDDKITLCCHKGNEEQEPYTKTYEQVHSILSDDDVCDDEIDKQIGQVLDIDDECRLPELQYEDVTEQEIFGSDSIKKDDLEDKERGLWANHGNRKFKFTINNNQYLDYELNQLKTIKFYFDKVDNREIDRIEVDVPFEQFSKNAESHVFFCAVDTNELGKIFTDNTHKYLFQGVLEFSYDNSEYKSDNTKCITITEIFPIKLILKNTVYYPNKRSCVPLDLTPVSIDFGTSSTCVAVKRNAQIEMLAISHTESFGGGSVNKFENPTNIMIYRWEQLIAGWIKNPENFPLVTQGSYQEYIQKIKSVDFDFGYTVKELLESVDKKQLDAIMTEIKKIPYLIDKGNQHSISPYVKENKEVVYITDAPETQDDEHFDPIAFYGYLIGRVINTPATGNIYVKYRITYPVKFNETVRNKVKNSLEYGLKMSIPISLRTALDENDEKLFEVRMEYSEPQAYMGAICGKNLKCDDGPKMFAVYDFGGGTLDYSFGLFRVDADGEAGIDFLGSGGDERFGGEFLISLISLWILSDESNKQEIIDKKILFMVPDGELIPGGFPEELLKSGQLARSNIQKLNERFSRNLFECKIETENISESIELFNIDGKTDTVELTVDYSILRDKLNQKIDEKVKDFKKVLINTFSRNADILKKYNIEFKVEDVNIFKSGNSSRSELVEEQMAKQFCVNNENGRIFLIDETESGDKDMRYAVTPKTAVAYGQLRLSNFSVNITTEFFKWYVIVENRSNGKYKIIIDRNEKMRTWKKYDKIRDGRCSIRYSDQILESVNDGTPSEYEMKCPSSTDGKYVYIQIKDETTIATYISQDENPPDESITETEIQLIKLGDR